MANDIVSEGSNSVSSMTGRSSEEAGGEGGVVQLGSSAGKSIVDIEGDADAALDKFLSSALDGQEPEDAESESGGDTSTTDTSTDIIPVAPDNEGEAETAGRPEAHSEKSASEDEPKGDLTLPETYSAEDKAKFDALPPKSKSFVLERTKALDASFTRKTQELAEVKKFSEAVLAEFSPYQQQMAVSGMEPVPLMRQLLALNAAYMKDPASYILWVCKQSGLNPASLAGEAPTDGETDEFGDPVEVDPATAKLYSHVDALTQTVQDLINTNQSSVSTSMASALQAFTSAAVEGNPDQLLYPHYETVKAKMAHSITTDPSLVTLVATDPGKALKQAYDNAVWTTPELREALIGGEKARLAEDAEKKRKEEIAAAEKSGRVVTGGASGSPSQPSDIKNLDDALNAATQGTDYAVA